MDRDKAGADGKAYRALVLGEGRRATPSEAVTTAYGADETDNL